jgi:hypothetical protein
LIEEVELVKHQKSLQGAQRYKLARKGRTFDRSEEGKSKTKEELGDGRDLQLGTILYQRRQQLRS